MAYRELVTQKFALCLKPRYAKFQRSSAKETFSKIGVKRKEIRKMCISETVKNRAKVTINQ